MKRLLLLNPPSFKRFDSAGARFQATRKTRSMWYPTWLGYAAAIIPNSRVLDCPAQNISIEALRRIAQNFDVIAFYTSTPTINNDISIAEFLKNHNPHVKIVFVGPHVSFLPKDTLKKSPSIDVVIRKEFDIALKDYVEGKPINAIKGLTWRKKRQIVSNPDIDYLIDLDKFDFVSKIYKRDLPIKKYYLPFTLYPYIAVYTARGCPHKCTFCLWPHVFTGRKYNTRSVANVMAEVKYIKKNLPEIREIFFDDDTFVVDRERVEKFCTEIKKYPIKWSVNARADVPFELLRKMKEAGLRLLVVGYESASPKILKNIRKGITLGQMVQFTRNCQKLGVMIHATFVLGLPGETMDSINQTMSFAKRFNFDTIQVSIATPLPGTSFYEYCKANGNLKAAKLVDANGYQSCSVNYEHLPSKKISEMVEKFHQSYYFRLNYIGKMAKMALLSNEEGKRIAKMAFEYMGYLAKGNRR